MDEEFNKAAAADALEVLALAYIAERDKLRRKLEPQDFKLVRFGDIMNQEIPTPKQARRSRIIRNPLLGAYRLAMREIGDHVWEHTKSYKDMRSVLEDVAKRHPECSGALYSAIDHIWDGVGSVWWA